MPMLADLAIQVRISLVVEPVPIPERQHQHRHHQTENHDNNIYAQVKPQHAAVYRPHKQNIQSSEEHTSELQSLMRTSYPVLCWQNQTPPNPPPPLNNHTHKT